MPHRHPDDPDTRDERIVRLTVAQNEIEAEIVCSMLRTEGIPATHRIGHLGVVGVIPGKAGAVGTVITGAGGAFAGEVMRGSGGPREILIPATRYEEARELLGAGDLAVDPQSAAPEVPNVNPQDALLDESDGG